MSIDHKIRTGYRVIGPNTSTGELNDWYFPTEKEANRFAARLSQSTNEEVDVCKYLGSYRRVIPTEYIKATDTNEEAIKEEKDDQTSP